MPSEPSDGIFDALAIYRRGVGAVKYPDRHSRYTVIHAAYLGRIFLCLDYVLDLFDELIVMVTKEK